MHATPDHRKAAALATATLALLTWATSAHAQASSPAPAGAATPAAQAGSAPTPDPQAQVAAGLARPSDTIGEAADRQRMRRMFETTIKQSAAQPGQAGQGPAVPGIQVERLAGASAGQGGPGIAVKKPVEETMVLSEVLRGPSRMLAGIDVLGVNRIVGVGEDLGNGWRVKIIERFQAVLVSSDGKSKAGNKGKGSERTITLPLRAPDATTTASAQASAAAR